MAANTERPVIAITMGDPCGIGPEVIVKALSEPDVHAICRPIVIGSVPALKAALALTNAPLNTRPIDAPDQAEDDLSLVNIIDPQNLDSRQITVGRISPPCGRAAMEWVTAAAHLALNGSVNALATAPVNKEAASLAGYKAIGHMELLQEITGVSAVATMLISGSLRVVHLTTHRSLRVACDYVTRERVLSMLELTHDSFRRWGFTAPRIAAAALNPHASDGGLLGDEEAEAIAPAVRDAQRRGILAQGPIPADVVFHQAIRGAYDVVLAMYHDQGHIPIKGARLRTERQRQPGIALRARLRGPRHRIRHRRPRNRRPYQHGRDHPVGLPSLHRPRPRLPLNSLAAPRSAIIGVTFS